jgi:hypothetical protein
LLAQAPPDRIGTVVDDQGRGDSSTRPPRETGSRSF